MKFRALVILFVAGAMSACGDAGSPEPQADAGDISDAPKPESMTPPREAEFMVDQGFVKHMHLHAEQLGKLMQALDEGDLWEAMTPAFWLSRHDTIAGIPNEWQKYATEMRKAAFAVESAGDIESARRAAARIVDSCNGCHAEAGVDPVQ